MDERIHNTTADRVSLAAEVIRRHWQGEAQAAVILGTGLGELADEIAAEATIAYSDIPGFPRCSALAHAGRLVCGRLDRTAVIALQGRWHLYEGYTVDEIALPIRVLGRLGVRTLIVTNAAGGLNPAFAAGDVMLIDDHINLMGRAAIPVFCLRSPAPGLPSPDFWPQALARPRVWTYDPGLAAAAEAIARRGDFPLRRGVYVAVFGPSYETRAEYRALRRIGGDCVGMSTVPEVLAAAGLGLRVIGLSTITNVACPDAPKTVSAEEVVAVAAAALPKMRMIIRALIEANHALDHGDRIGTSSAP